MPQALGSHLVEMGAIDSGTLSRASRAVGSTRPVIVECIRTGKLSEDDVFRALVVTDFPVIADDAEVREVSVGAQRRLSIHLSEAWCAIVLDENDTVTPRVGFVDPTDKGALRAVTRALSTAIRPFGVRLSAFDSALARRHEQPDRDSVDYPFELVKQVVHREVAVSRATSSIPPSEPVLLSKHRR